MTTGARTLQFYVLPKIHKEHNETFPIGYPGRPIVSACNSYTENISGFIDENLQPHVKNLGSYVKDTTDFFCASCKMFLMYIRKHFSGTGCYITV